MRFEDFYSITSKSKQIKNLQESKVFHKLTPDEAFDKALNLWVTGEQIPKVLEDIIATDPFNASMYAREIVKGRWPQGEETILNSEYKVDYINFLKKIGYEDLEESTTLQNMSPDDAYDKAVDLFNKKEPIPKELEDIIATHAQNALNYAYYILKGRFLKGEPAISKNGMMAIDYAMEVVGGRFPEGEEAISEDPELHDEYIEFLNSIGYEDLEESTSNNPYKNLSSDQAYDLAINLSSKNTPIPKGLEEIIAQDPHNSYFYAKYVVKGRFPQGEPMIMSNLDAKANYIRFLNKIGYEDLEESTSNQQRNPYKNLSPENAYYKAVDLFVINEPIPKELEKIIATDPNYAYFYAKDIIKSRFPQGEEAILNGSYKDNYINFLKSINYQDVEESFENFFNSNIQESNTPLTPHQAYEWAVRFKQLGSKIPDEMEDVIAKDPKASFAYAKFVKKAPFKKGEPVMASDTQASYNYATEVLKDRFLEGEKSIVVSPSYSYWYVRDVIRGRWPEGEPAILSDDVIKDDYIDYLNRIGHEDVEESFVNFFNSTVNESFIPDDPEDAYELAKNYKYANKQIPEELENVLAESPQYSYMYAKYILGDKPFPKGESVISQNYTYALDYARKVLKNRFPLAEELLSKDPDFAFLYARDVIKGRFPEGEEAIMSLYHTKRDYIKFLKYIGYEDVEESIYLPGSLGKALRAALDLKSENQPIPEELEDVIATDPFSSHIYARDGLGGPFPKGESAIAKNGYWSFFYAIEVLKGRFPEGEEAIFRSSYKDDYLDYLKQINYQDLEESFEQFFTEAKRKVRPPTEEELTDPDRAYNYAFKVIKGKWPQGEPTLMKNPQTAYAYALKVIKGRWKEAEPIIMNDPLAAYRYAFKVIKGRWKKAEPIIMKDSYTAFMYAKHVIKGRWPQLEPIIMNDPIAALQYAEDVIKGRWKEAEPIIMKDLYAAFKYAKYVIKGRWPEAEEIIFTDPIAKEQYIQFLKSINYQDVEESFELYFTEAKRKVRPPTEEELTDPYAAAEYAENVLKGRFPEGEPVIIKAGIVSIEYARDVIKGRWPEFENRLINNPNDYDYDEEVGDVIMGYIGEVIQGRWPEIEPFIFSNDYLKREYTDYLKSMNYQDVEESFKQFFTEAKRKVRKPNKEERTDPLSAAIYASDVVQGRVPELEPLILTDYAAIAQYIWFAIKGRWKEAEETIANSEPSRTARYAAEILKDRWINIPDIPKEIALQAEENIINDPWIASVYAQEAIKGRWPEAEEIILSEPDSKEDYINFLKSINYQDLEESFELYFTEAKDKVRKPNKKERTDPELAYYYARDVVKGRVPELEPLILTDNMSMWGYIYHIINGRWPEAEEIIATGDPDEAAEYAENILKGRWPEGEASILSEPDSKERYINFLNSINYQDLEESFEQFFTEAKGKVRKPNKEERTDPVSAYYYAKDVVQGRVPELEPLIINSYNPTLAPMYALNVIGGRWPELEKDIIDTINLDLTLSDATIFQTVMYYIYEVVKGRWPEIEPILFHYDEHKEDYINFLKSINYQDVEESFEQFFTEAKGKVRKPTKEERTDPEAAYEYAKDVVKGRVPELEPFIINAGTVAPDYARDVIKGRWPELEKVLLKDLNLYDDEIEDFTLEVIMYYIYEVIKGRWEEVEPTIFLFDNLKKEYINFLKSINHSDLEESYKLR